MGASGRRRESAIFSGRILKTKKEGNGLFQCGNERSESGEWVPWTIDEVVTHGESSSGVISSLEFFRERSMQQIRSLLDPYWFWTLQ